MNKVKAIVQIIVFLAIAITISKLTYYLTGFDSLFEKLQNLYFVAFIILCIQLFYCLENLLLVFLFAKFTDGLTLSEVGIAFNKRSVKLFLIGTLFAVIAAIITWLAFLYIFDPYYAYIGKWLLTIFFIIVSIPVTFFQATAEELIYRTWMLKKLGNTITPFAAVIAVGIIFGGVHMFNPVYTWLSAINAGLLGIATSIAYFRTKSVWMSSGIHFGWNYFLGIVYLPFLFTATYHGKTVYQFIGAEATTVGCIAMVAICVAVYYFTRKKKIITNRCS